MLRSLSSVVLLWLVAVSGSGCRETGVVARATAGETQQPAAQQTVQLPNTNGSLKFGVLGDFGTGDKSQYQRHVAGGTDR